MIFVPPVVGPLDGLTLAIVGASTTNVNAFSSVAVAFTVVTAIFCAPSIPAGVTAVINVSLRTTTLVAATPPTVTLLTLSKFAPSIVIVVPPKVDPEVGEMLAMVGAGPPPPLRAMVWTSPPAIAETPLLADAGMVH